MVPGSGGSPAGAIVGGNVQDPGSLGNALRQLLARTEIQETRALIAVSDALATFRVLRFPAATNEQAIDSAVAKELSLDPERMATRWIDLYGSADHRTIYAVAWERSYVKRITEAARLAGLEPIAVELKSASVARVVAEPSCVVLDMSSDPVEIVLIDSHIPQLWHSFDLKVPIGDDLVPTLIPPLRTVLRFYKRRRESEFTASSPILISGEQVLPTNMAANLSQALGHPVAELPAPARAPLELRHSPYLTCLGLLMRRS